MSPPPPKRKRLTYACNYCREKKTRCDEGQPSCRNCRLAGVECVTTDKRRAGVIVGYRRRSNATISSAISPLEGRGQVETPVSQVQSQPSPAPVPPVSTSTSAQRVRLSAQCWDRAGWRSGRLPMMPRFVGGCMFEIMTEWLDLAFYRLRIPAPHDSVSQGGLVGRKSIPQGAPVLPSMMDMRAHGGTFLRTVCCIFPFMSMDEVYSVCDSIEKTSSEETLAYLVTTTALMTFPEDNQDRISAYINNCNTLLGHIVSERALASIQGILLYSIVLRSTDHIAWAWDVLSLGVSMAQSTGIHQERGNPTWWCMYVFEKILAFESGRASMIWDRELSQPEQLQDGNKGGKYKWACISMANTLHELQDRAAGAWRREEWLPQSVDEAIEEKITTGGELALLLDGWWKDVPVEFQGASFSDPCISQQSAFLSFYYRYALILLNRSVLLVETSEMREMLDRYAAGKPWQHRIANGASICVEAARDMIKLTVAMVDSGLPTYFTSFTSPLTAVYALAVHVLRERGSLLVRSDFELIKAGIAMIKQSYRRLEGASRVNEVLSALETYTAQALNDQVPTPFNNEAYEMPLADPSQFGWPSALDWAGWDWNDLSHLFEGE